MDKAWAFCVRFSNGALEFLIKSFTFLGNCCHIKQLLEGESCKRGTDREVKGSGEANLERITGALILEQAKDVSQV